LGFFFAIVSAIGLKITMHLYLPYTVKMARIEKKRSAQIKTRGIALN